MVALLVPSMADAQAGSFYGGANCYQVDGSTGTGAYTTTTRLETATSWSSSCSIAGGRASNTASAANGILKITGAASLDDNSLGLVSGRGTVTWNDYLVVVSGTAAAVRFEFTANGLLSQTSWKSTPTTVTNTVSVASLSSYGGGADVKFGDYAVAAAIRPMLTDYQESPSGTMTVTVGVIFPWYVPFNYSLSVDPYLYSALRHGGGGAYTSNSGEVLADFGSTAGLTGVTFLDANGKAVRNVQYRFGNGTTFYNPNANVTVPEPQTSALAMMGLVAMFAVARRRHRDV